MLSGHGRYLVRRGLSAAGCPGGSAGCAVTGFHDEVMHLRQTVADAPSVVWLDAVRAVAAVEAAAVRDRIAPHEILAVRRDNADALSTIGRQLDAVIDIVLDRIDFIDVYDWPIVCATRSGIEYLLGHGGQGGPGADALRRTMTHLDAELRHAGAAFGPVQEAWRIAGIPPHHWWWWHPEEPWIGLVVEYARVLTDVRVACTPSGSSVRLMLGSIRAQLSFLADAVAAGKPLTIEEVNRLTFGVIAVREFEDTDPEFCDALTFVAFRAKALA